MKIVTLSSQSWIMSQQDRDDDVIQKVLFSIVASTLGPSVEHGCMCVGQTRTRQLITNSTCDNGSGHVVRYYSC